MTFWKKKGSSGKPRDANRLEFPVEILTEIFSYVVSDFYYHVNEEAAADQAYFEDETENNDLGDRDATGEDVFLVENDFEDRREQRKPSYLRSRKIFSRFSRINSNKQRFSLMSVCRHWNHVLINTPLLWRTVELVDTIPTDMCILKKRLSRAGSILLDVIFEPRNTTSAVAFAALSLILRSYSEQIRVLRIDFSSFDPSFGYFQPESHKDRLSSFSNLQIFMLLDPRGHFYHILQRPIHSTRLHSLSIEGPYLILKMFTDVTLNSVRYLSIDQTGDFIPEEHFPQLALCRNVCVVHWTFANDLGFPDDVNLLWPCVKAFDLRLYFHSEEFTFRHHVDIPMLETFSLFSLIGWDDFAICNALACLFTSSPSYLKHLHLLHLMLTEPEMDGLANMLPELRTLTFTACQLSLDGNAPERFLIPIADSLPLPCPKLEKITFNYTAVSASMLLKLINSRRCLAPDSTLEILIACNGRCEHEDENGADCIAELETTFPDIVQHFPDDQIMTAPVVPVFGTTGCWKE